MPLKIVLLLLFKNAALSATTLIPVPHPKSNYLNVQEALQTWIIMECVGKLASSYRATE